MKNVFLMLGTMCLIVGLYRYSPYYTDKGTVTVELIHPYITSIQDSITLHGTITDEHPQKIYAHHNSKVLAVYAEQGDTVEAGQLLMTLERLDTPQAEQMAAAALLSELQQTVEEGDLESTKTLLEDIATYDYTLEDFTPQEKVYNLYSPCTGTVIETSATVGDTIGPILPCMEISDPQHLRVEAAAGEDVISLLQEGMDCAISIPAFSLEQLPGQVEKIAPYAHKTSVLTGNPVVETAGSIIPLEGCETLRSGYRATAKIYTSHRDQAVLIPYEAVMQDDAGEYVYRLQENTIYRQPILSGAELADYLEVCSGINAGDLIVWNPQVEWEGKVIHFAY